MGSRVSYGTGGAGAVQRTKRKPGEGLMNLKRQLERRDEGWEMAACRLQGFAQRD